MGNFSVKRQKKQQFLCLSQSKVIETHNSYQKVHIILSVSVRKLQDFLVSFSLNKRKN